MLQKNRISNIKSNRIAYITKTVLLLLLPRTRLLHWNSEYKQLVCVCMCACVGGGGGGFALLIH